MSTKIYYAYRMPHRLFSEAFLPTFRKHVFATAAEETTRLMEHVPVEDLKKMYEEGKESRWKKVSFKKWQAVPKYRLGTLFNNMVEASKSKARSGICIDCSLNVWLHKGWMYCILYGEHWLWEKYTPPAGVEDYCYWNNTDEPDNVTRRQWQAREKNWDAVCLKDHNATRMVHEVIHASQEIGLHDVGRLILDNEDDVWAATWLIT